MDSAPAVAAELWRPPHLGAGGGRAVEATSAITEKSSGGRGGGGAGRRKQREAPASEDDSSRIVSTSGGGGQDLLNEPTAASASGVADCRHYILKENYSVGVGIFHSLAYPDLFDEQTDSGPKRFKTNKSNDNNGNLRTEADTDSRSAGKAISKKSPAPEPPKQDYIHVRARRGQATDSHSLAERVSGCNLYLYVSGKASVLDEIINYIQSLQCQVEFAAPTYSTAPGLTFDTQTPREYAQGASTSEWLHMQIGNGAYGRVS
ncbi:hypothetical protein HU200_003086 [Digitaria exilis]|uniref:Uncharacterized protein n=1 Tax=Digitaria exilis TaxID=1010633 RepID=A0A835FXC4_9POAL|nr:hypothetical protein HU200_003086 [Digitaria exilis]